MRASRARATVRVHGPYGGQGPTLPNGLARPGRPRAPAHHPIPVHLIDGSGLRDTRRRGAPRIPMSTVLVDRDREVLVVTINRPEVRNAADAVTAAALLHAFQEYDRDDQASVAVLTGAGGTFCAGADLKAIAAGEQRKLAEDAPAPLGPTRLLLSKPLLAAVEGHAVAGGLELALWCDLRIAAVNAVFGVFCRRFGVPLLDLGTVRLPRLIGHSHAMDQIGRASCRERG